MSSTGATDEAGMKGGSGFRAFTGTGHRLDGKSKSSTTSLTEMEAAERSLPQLTVNTNYTPGKLEFVRSVLSLFFLFWILHMASFNLLTKIMMLTTGIVSFMLSGVSMYMTALPQ